MGIFFSLRCALLLDIMLCAAVARFIQRRRKLRVFYGVAPTPPMVCVALCSIWWINGVNRNQVLVNSEAEKTKEKKFRHGDIRISRSWKRKKLNEFYISIFFLPYSNLGGVTRLQRDRTASVPSNSNSGGGEGCRKSVEQAPASRCQKIAGFQRIWGNPRFLQKWIQHVNVSQVA